MKYLLLGLLGMGLSGQSLIVGIPSTDVAPKGELAIAHETQLNRFTTGGYWNSFSFATYGIGNGLEFALLAFHRIHGKMVTVSAVATGVTGVGAGNGVQEDGRFGAWLVGGGGSDGTGFVSGKRRGRVDVRAGECAAAEVENAVDGGAELGDKTDLWPDRGEGHAGRGATADEEGGAGGRLVHGDARLSRRDCRGELSAIAVDAHHQRVEDGEQCGKRKAGVHGGSGLHLRAQEARVAGINNAPRGRSRAGHLWVPP